MNTFNTVHVFDEDLKRSFELSGEASWVEFYRSFWPNAVVIIGPTENCQWQKWGVDRLILLPDGQQISIDEKKRSGTWTDFLVEVKTRYENGTEQVGWTLDPKKRCDFIAYATPELGLCRLLPFQILRITAKRELEKWRTYKKQPGPAKNNNNGYTWDTFNVCVDWDVLFRDMRATMEAVKGNGASLRLTHADQNKGQLTFGVWGALP